ncbi:hypothetical protein ACKWRH_21450 [Bradyrhizobium sp. Pa8]|uniref:hypothetical protein n=1 Tax=Bradyrhizobium sp. Pa8 TaxID=3386552 RepID=UPI00403F5183
MSADKFLYFGCYQEAGHYLFESIEGHLRKVHNRPEFNFDGLLCPRDPKPYVAALTRLGGLGYSALAFWDYSVDSRGGSNSIFFAPSLVCSGETIAKGAERFFPEVWRRLPEFHFHASASAPAEQLYVPGQWRCPKCSFTLNQFNLNASDGSVTTRDEAGDKCPNCNSPLWRMTWRQDAMEMAERLANEVQLRRAAEERVKVLEAERGAA